MNMVCMCVCVHILYMFLLSHNWYIQAHTHTHTHTHKQIFQREERNAAAASDCLQQREHAHTVERGGEI
jgi:hypothetical protein